MTEFYQGNILEASTEALVNTVNTVGVMGKGVALQFKRKFPDNYKEYAKACKENRVKIGEMFIHQRNTLENPKYIFNFPTKRDWRESSSIEYVREGLEDLIKRVQELDIESIALPPLGCGNGKLNWSDVRPLIEAAAARLPTVHFIVYEPRSDSEPMPLAANGREPALTPVRAALISLFKSYENIGEDIGRLEAQKIAYFLQDAGMEMPGITFVQHKYGPYTNTLDHMLEDLEGHYLEGLGDFTTRSRIRVKNGAKEKADSLLEEKYPEILEFLQRTKELISGFEGPYGMELLSTVHWIICQENTSDYESMVRSVQHWNERKKYTFDEDHLRAAWDHLQSYYQTRESFAVG